MPEVRATQQMATLPKVIMMTSTFLALAILATIQETQGKPNNLHSLTGCNIDSKLQETCQKCAKATKSNVVYPMCCSNEDGVYLWCQKYLGFGIHG